MRQLRVTRFLPRRAAEALALALFLAGSAAGCQGFSEGYYSACDEPAGLAAGCTPSGGDPEPITAWDACMKLAACGVILTQEDPMNPTPETPDPIEACVSEIQKASVDLGDVVLFCIEHTSCPELQETIDENDDPNSQNGNIEGVIGWCGRLDPR